MREQLDKISKLYAEKGFFLAEVRYELDAAPQQRGRVRFVIDEGDEVTVRRIRFVGNDHLPSASCAAVMQTERDRLLLVPQLEQHVPQGDASTRTSTGCRRCTTTTAT